MYSKYNCNGKFHVSAIKLISAISLSFIFFLNDKAIKVGYFFPYQFLQQRHPISLPQCTFQCFLPEGLGGRTPMGN